MLYAKQVLRAAALAIAVDGADAFWRLPCRGRSGLGLIDPIVDPGRISTHAHTIHGPNKFGFDADSSSIMVRMFHSLQWIRPLTTLAI